VTPAKSRRPLDLQQRSTLAGEAAAAAAEVETALATPADPTAAAFFDVDNTLMQGASIFHLARGLHRRKFFTTREIASAAWKQAYFRIVGVEDPDHVAQTRASALSFIRGHTVQELEELGEEIFDEAMAPRIWPGTRALAQMHLDEGQRVWLVTAAPIEIAQIIACRLGLTGALGTVAEHQDGVYTGRLVGEMLHGPAKGEAVRALAEREGLDLEACSAYSDSYNDLTMLSMVGDPCAVNPDARLRAYARHQGWRIRDYRTGRKAARAGLFAAAVAGAATGAVVAGVADRPARTPAAGLTPPGGLCHSGLPRRRCPPTMKERRPPGAREEPAMTWADHDTARGLHDLRAAVLAVLGVHSASVALPAGAPAWMLLSEATVGGHGTGPGGPGGGFGDADQAASSEDSEADRSRLIALVELARGGDAEAFGQLYDHYQGSVYRFVFYRTRSQTLAEDLTSETFLRALRNMSRFRWQGKDFGAWLMTIARNLCTDHFKAGRTRLELTTDDMGVHDDATESPENAVLAGLTNEVLLDGLRRLSDEQRDCLIMRFLQGLSIAETAEILGRSEGAIKQLQLRGVRNLARLMPDGWRDE
jgi:HAD superfamily hydrolase (TIGR01490 family)/RNA polymerase sigma-70 factor (TIGR02952 family)